MIFIPTVAVFAITILSCHHTNAQGIICDVGYHPMMDAPTAQRLAGAFCIRLPENFPAFAGENFSSPGYPTDLPPTSSHPDLLAMERSGLIAWRDFDLRGAYIEDNGTIVPYGTKEQCAKDNCTEIFDSIIKRCEVDSHSYGGYNGRVTDCGIYTLFIQNCTDNHVDWNCRRWHDRWQPSCTGTRYPSISFTVETGATWTSISAVATVTFPDSPPCTLG